MSTKATIAYGQTFHFYDDRIRDYEAAVPEKRGWVSLCGGWVFGQADDPRDAQIEQGVAHYLGASSLTRIAMRSSFPTGGIKSDKTPVPQ